MSSSRGIITVADLRARCRVNADGCWIWQGAVDKRSGQPRIYTIDYGKATKRTMSGPQAAWNIAHGEAPPSHRPLAYRGCVSVACLNPAHLRLAADLAEIGRHIRLSGRRRGYTLSAKRRDAALRSFEARGVRLTPPEIVLALRAAPASVTSSALARQYGLKVQTAWALRTGRSNGGMR